MTREELNIALDAINERMNKSNIDFAENLCNVESEYRQKARDLKAKRNRTIADFEEEYENAKLALFNKFQADRMAVTLGLKTAKARCNREKEKLFADYKLEHPTETTEGVNHGTEGNETAKG